MEQLWRSVRGFWDDLNPATLSGAIDVIVVKQPDGTLKSTPFYVRFGKLTLIRPQERLVLVAVNGKEVTLPMKVGKQGECYFVQTHPTSDMDIEDSEMSCIDAAASDDNSESGSESLDTQESSSSERQHHPQQPTEQQGSDGSGTDTSSPTRDVDVDSYVEETKALLLNKRGSRQRSSKSLMASPTSPGKTAAEKGDSGSDDDGEGGVEDDEDDVFMTPLRTIGSTEDMQFRNSDVAGYLQKSVQGLQSTRNSSALADASNQVSAATMARSDRDETTPSSSNLGSPSRVRKNAPIAESQQMHQKQGDAQAVANHSAHAAIGDAKSDQQAETARRDVALASRGSETGPAQQSSVRIGEDAVSSDNTTGESSPKSVSGGVTDDTEQLADRLSSSSSWIMGGSGSEEDNDDGDGDERRSTDNVGEGSEDGDETDVEKDEQIGSHQASARANNEKGDYSSSNTVGQEADSTDRGEDTAVPAHRTVITSVDDMIDFDRQQQGSDAAEPTSQKSTVESVEQHSSESHWQQRRHSGASTITLTPHVDAHGGQQQYQQQDGEVRSRSSSIRKKHKHAMTLLQQQQQQQPTQTLAGMTIEGSEQSMDISLSLCGFKAGADKTLLVSEEDFDAQLVTFDTMLKNPNVFENKALVARLGTRYFTWKAAAPQLMAYVLFKKSLPQSVVEKLVGQHHRQRGWFFWGGRDHKHSETSAKMSGSVSSDSAIAAVKKERVRSGNDADVEDDDDEDDDQNAATPLVASRLFDGSEDADHTAVTIADGKSINGTNASLGGLGLGDGNADSASELSGAQKKKRAQRRRIASGTSEDGNDSMTETEGMTPVPLSSNLQGVRTRHLSNEQLGALELKPGVNRIEYRVVSKYQGISTLTCNVFLWDHADKIFISDIDGTITKSDVLGHAAPLLGRDWTQTGVASLFRKIADNKYRVVYLSSRSISQARTTKEYMAGIDQEGQGLPAGPILLSPTSLFRSLHREVIIRRPQEFKIGCLTAVKDLFPTNPFVAGFGNRDTDVVTYRAVGIADSKIFVIDPRGLLRVSSGSYTSSYSKLSDLVDQVFPPITQQQLEEKQEFASFSYWREPLPALDDFDLDSISL